MSMVSVLALVGGLSLLLAAVYALILVVRAVRRRSWSPEVRDALNTATAVSDALWREHEGYGGTRRG